MREKEVGLAAKTTAILQKDTRHMNLVDIIADLVEFVEKQETMMDLFLMDKKAPYMDLDDE